jgi:hypothetical protein
LEFYDELDISIWGIPGKSSGKTSGYSQTIGISINLIPDAA